MKWNYNSNLSIPSGETRTITYETEGVFAGGRWTETWLEFSVFAGGVYSWPSAGIEVIDLRDSTSLTTSGGTMYAVYYQLWVDTYLLWAWETYN